MHKTDMIMTAEEQRLMEENEILRKNFKNKKRIVVKQTLIKN